MAICRSLNVAARLNPVTLEPEYYRDGAFHSVETEAAVLKDETESAVLTLNRRMEAHGSIIRRGPSESGTEQCLRR